MSIGTHFALPVGGGLVDGDTGGRSDMLRDGARLCITIVLPIKQTVETFLLNMPYDVCRWMTSRLK